MSFATNLTGTLVVGAFNSDGSPSGAQNNKGVLGNPFAVGADNMNGGQFLSTDDKNYGAVSGVNADKTLGAGFGNLAGAASVHQGTGYPKDSLKRRARNYYQGDTHPRPNTSLRAGKWDRYNGWNTDRDASTYSGLWSPYLDFSKGLSGIAGPLSGTKWIYTSRDSNLFASSVDIDRANSSAGKTTFTSFYGSGPRQDTLPRIPTEEEFRNCTDCPDTLKDEEETWTVARACWPADLDFAGQCFSEYKRAPVFSGVFPVEQTGTIVISGVPIQNPILNVTGYWMLGENADPPNEDVYEYNFSFQETIDAWKEHIEQMRKALEQQGLPEEAIENHMQVFGISCEERLREAVGRDCSFVYARDTLFGKPNWTYLGSGWNRPASQSGAGWTGWCDYNNSENVDLPSANGWTNWGMGLHEPSVCGPYSGQNVLLGCDADNQVEVFTYVGDFEGYGPQVCCEKYAKGERQGKGDPNFDPETMVRVRWNGCSAGAYIGDDRYQWGTTGDNCINTYNIFDPSTCSFNTSGFPVVNTQYVYWPSGAGGATGEAYWDDDKCAWMWPLRAVVDITGDATNPCTTARNANFPKGCSASRVMYRSQQAADSSPPVSGVGPVLRVPLDHIVVNKGVETDGGFNPRLRKTAPIVCLTGVLSTGTPADVPVEAQCGDCFYMWDGSAWSLSSSTCSGTCSPPTVDGHYPTEGRNGYCSDCP